MFCGDAHDRNRPHSACSFRIFPGISLAEVSYRNNRDVENGSGQSVLPTATSPRHPLVPEQGDFQEGDAPAADKVQAFQARAMDATGRDADQAAAVLVHWICDAPLSNHSVRAYGRDFLDFVRHMQAQGVAPLEVTADHAKLYRRGLLEAGTTSATVARQLSVLRGAYRQLAAKGQGQRTLTY